MTALTPTHFRHLVDYLWLAVAILGLLGALRRRRPRLRSRRQWYRTEYLASDHWRQFRHEWWQRHPGASCADCGGSAHPMDLHHLTYARIGHERDDDVMPLHRACHEARHRAAAGAR